MEQDRVTVTEVSHGPKVKALWHIKGFKEDFNYKQIKKLGKCLLKPGFIAGSDFPVELSFWFEENEYDADEDVTERAGLYKINTWIDLYVTVQSCHRQFMFSVDVEVLDELGGVKSTPVEGQMFSIESDFDAQAELLKSKFLLVSQKEYNRYKGAKSNKTNLRPDELRIRFSASLIHFINAADAGGDAVSQSKTSLVNDLKKFSEESENFSDLKIQTKDNKTVDAHKFILAARSTVLLKLIKEEGSSGTLKLGDVSERALSCLMKWMYSGEVQIQDYPDIVIEEIIGAALKFEMNDLLKILDRKLITVCTTDNMFDLFKVAKKNFMSVAMVDISNFIKMNLGKLVLEELV